MKEAKALRRPLSQVLRKICEINQDVIYVRWLNLNVFDVLMASVS